MTTIAKRNDTRTNVITAGCDICWGKNHFVGMKLTKCRICNVHVHPLCYGHCAPNGDEEYYEKHLFECWACRALGKELHGRELLTGKHKKLRVRERPTECCLCGVDNGKEFLHAMHPIYDNHGKSGRQVILPAGDGKPERLAWAHSLCCFALCSHHQTTGCVYGCTMDGSYDGEDDDDTSKVDKNDINPDLQRLDASHGGKDSIHHFAYCGIRNNDDETDPWIQRIHELQQLKCRLCGKDDRPAHVLRIPVQCSANDPSEFEEFRGKHVLLGNDTCYMAQHVGCAIWRKDDTGAWPKRRRVYFHPGRPHGELFVNPVINVFCNAHAEDLCDVGGGRLLRYPGVSEKMHAATGRPVGQSPRTGSISLGTMHSPKHHDGEHRRSNSLSGLSKKSTDQERSAKRRASFQGTPTRKTIEKSTVATSPAKAKHSDSNDGGNTPAPDLDSASPPTKSVPPDRSTEKVLGHVPRKATTSSSQQVNHNAGLLDGAAATNSIQSGKSAAGLDHVPRKKTAPSEGEPKKKRKVSAVSKGKRSDDIEQDKSRKVSSKRKRSDEQDKRNRPADMNPLSPEASLKTGNVRKKKKALPSESQKKDGTNQAGELANPGVLKRSISESKCHAYDDSELERKYLKILESLKGVMENVVYSKETLQEVMAEKRPTWEKQVNAPRRVFNVLWSKVESAVSKNVDFSGEDWSFLVVGKNFDLDRMNFGKWDSYKVINQEDDTSV